MHTQHGRVVTWKPDLCEGKYKNIWNIIVSPIRKSGPQFTRRLSIFQLFRLTWLRQQAGPSTLDFLVIILRSNWRYKSGPPLEELRA